ncbi:MAG: TetR/AcrR family transcriptional regulator [Gemmatimonadales bacterium]|nr:MAG: TetR/AcrR family transcriptional regulator [Gemmatimonadales bacterium]
MTRPYNMTRRNRLAAATADRILDATESRLKSGALADVTLSAVSKDAGVSVQTVLRHFGSRTGLMEETSRRVGERIDRHRSRASPDNPDAALDILLEHYEEEGALVLNLLAHETAEPVALRAVEEGRRFHRAWVDRVFGPTEDPEILDALVAATDISIWKLLRVDLKRSPSQVRRTMEALVAGVRSETESEPGVSQ